MTRLALEDIACRRGGRLLFSGLDVSIGPGDLLHLKGSNGCGKSSLLRLIAGLADAASGSITLSSDGGDPIDPRDSCVLLEEIAALKPTETLQENLALWSLLMGQRSTSADMIRAAEALGMAALLDMETRTFSTGQRRRAALARLLLTDRPVWLLDEPMNGLDTKSRVLVTGLLHAHRCGGGLIVVASHDTDFEDARTVLLDDLKPRAADVFDAEGEEW